MSPPTSRLRLSRCPTCLAHVRAEAGAPVVCPFCSGAPRSGRVGVASALAAALGVSLSLSACGGKGAEPEPVVVSPEPAQPAVYGGPPIEVAPPIDTVPPPAPEADTAPDDTAPEDTEPKPDMTVQPVYGGPPVPVQPAVYGGPPVRGPSPGPKRQD